jgi:uncharacterized protein YoxC
VVDPLFWLGFSILLVAVSLTAVLITALPALQELARAARSAEKLFDTLRRELPPTLEAIRLTGLEITDLTDDVSQGVQSAGQIVKQVDQSISGAKKQAQQLNSTTRSVMVGIKAAWRTFTRPQRTSSTRRASDRYLANPKGDPSTQREATFFPENERITRPVLDANPDPRLQLPDSSAPQLEAWELDEAKPVRRESVNPSHSSVFTQLDEEEAYEDGEGFSQGSTIHSHPKEGMRDEG